MKKIACVFSFRLSSWVSCQKIVFNLHKAYHMDKNLNLLNFNYSVDTTLHEMVETAHAIRAEEPDVVAIMDHKPHPITFLQILLPLFGAKKPRIVFHVFGDFTLYYPHWEKLAPHMTGFEIDFIVASERQKLLIDKFLIAPTAAKLCPFPVDKKEFSYQPALRAPQRQEWKLNDNDVAFVFTGRLSRQKRIHTLLKSFNEILEKNHVTNAHLFIYGNTDNVGDRFLGKWETEGEYFRKIHRLLRSLPPHTQSKIHFMGGVPNSELKAVYQGADYLVNLSVHNDEDYGMSVAEAQCAGLPSILTDWGGLAGFYHEEIPEATTYIPVKIGKSAKIIHYESLIKAFEDSLNRKHPIDRQKISQLGLEKFGVEKAYRTMESILASWAPEFQGFSPTFEKVLQNVMLTPMPYITEKFAINNLYRNLYSAYVRNTSETV